MTLTDIIAVAFWPVIVAMVAYGWINRANTSRLATAWGLAALFAIAGMVAATIVNVQTLAMAFDIHLGLVLFGAFCLIALLTRWATFKVGIRVLLAVVGAGLVGMGLKFLVGDHLLSRTVVEGMVTRLELDDGGRGPYEYVVSINGVPHKIVGRDYRTLNVGERVRVEVGRGSGYVYRIERVR